jgi:hypothetical protein
MFVVAFYTSYMGYRGGFNGLNATASTTLQFDFESVNFYTNSN